MPQCRLVSIGQVKKIAAKTVINIKPDFRKALLNINEFSHILIFWDNSQKVQTIEKLSRYSDVKTIYAQQYPDSLNSIEITLAKLKAVNENGEIEVNNILIPDDAVLLDLKPYFPISDRVKNCTIPEYLEKTTKYYQEEPASSIQKILSSNDFTSDFKINSKTELSDISTRGKIVKKSGTCKIVMENKNQEFLANIQAYSHISLLWWFSRFDKPQSRKTTQCNPPYEKAPKTGVFASRSPVRPNPIAVTTTRILKVDSEKGEIEISYMDAFNNSPIIDIKPYIPCFNRVKSFSVPRWVDHCNPWYEEDEILCDAAEFVISKSDYADLLNLTNYEAKINTKEIAKTAKVVDENFSDYIFIKGARENNLKDVSVKIPKNKMTVITGLSGSGKSS